MPRGLNSAIVFAACLLAGAAAPAQEKKHTEGYIPMEEGVRLFYRRIGDGPQTVVIPWVTQSLVEELGELAKGRTLIFYAPRGRGRSDAVDPFRVSFENELKDLEAVRRHFGLESMALLGWSHYGMMTAVYTIRHPERVSRLVQMTPAAPRSDPYLQQGMNEMRSRADEKGLNELQEKRKAGAFAGDPAAECRAAKRAAYAAFVGARVVLDKIDLSDCDLPNEQTAAQEKWWTALFGSMGTWDLRGDLRKLRVPRLVIAGGKDFIPMAASREWVEGMPEARLLVLPDSGHFPNIEAPKTLLSAVDTFLKGGWPAEAQILREPV